MLTQPAIGAWLVPRIERIRAFEHRRIARLSVPGLSGDLSQDLGRGATCVEISGSLYGDEARDGFLKEVRDRFLAGDPVDFVADLLAEAELEQVLIEAFDLSESADEPLTFRYRLVLREYTEPPEPPQPALPEPDLDLEVELGLDLLDLPALLLDVPDLPKLEEMLEPVKTAAQKLRDLIESAPSALAPLADLLGD